ncbi:hypothetical protein N5P37_008821 [Trichoderma harzianum]|nr:hypothetical protein N5P37_008821 [Trichoderma harzianum]
MVWGWMDLAMLMLALPQMPLLAAAANAPFRRKGAGSGRSSSSSRMKGGHRPTSLAAGRKGFGAIRIRRACMLVLQKRVAKVLGASRRCYWRKLASCSSKQTAGGPLCLIQLCRMQFCLHMRPSANPPLPPAYAMRCALVRTSPTRACGPRPWRSQ